MVLKIRVKVKPGSVIEEFKKINEFNYFVSLKERAIDGKANFALKKILAREFKVSSKDVVIKTFKGRNKIVEIL